MTKGAKTINLDEKKVKKEKSETGKRMDELRKAMHSMGVRHATVENITRYLLQNVVDSHSIVDPEDNTGTPLLDSDLLLKDLATAIRGYEKVVVDDVKTPGLDW